LSLPVNGDTAEPQIADVDESQPQINQPSQAVEVAINTVTEDSVLPAEVMQENQNLEPPVTLEDEEAIALDPQIDLIENSDQLTESLSADPSDYTVANNGSIEIQASETLGHYADWLEIRAWDIRRLNNMAYRDPVIIGDRINLNFSEVNASEFELRRKDYHVTLQRQFFASYRIQGVENYKVRSGDNVGSIARRQYATPVWLLRQYNPELDFNRIQIDQEIIFPVLEQVN